MVVEASTSAMTYFLPIFAFLLVFIVVFALLKKTEILGDNQAIMLFISLILASFFVVEASLVEFVRFSSAWFAVIIIVIFFALIAVAFVPGKEPFGFLSQGNWFSWVALGLIVGLFIIASAYVFNWAINWAELFDWFDTDWFGMILLLIIAGIVAWKIKD